MIRLKSAPHLAENGNFQNSVFLMVGLDNNIIHDHRWFSRCKTHRQGDCIERIEARPDRADFHPAGFGEHPFQPNGDIAVIPHDDRGGQHGVGIGMDVLEMDIPGFDIQFIVHLKFQKEGDRFDLCFMELHGQGFSKQAVEASSIEHIDDSGGVSGREDVPVQSRNRASA